MRISNNLQCCLSALLLFISSKNWLWFYSIRRLCFHIKLKRLEFFCAAVFHHLHSLHLLNKFVYSKQGSNATTIVHIRTNGIKAANLIDILKDVSIVTLISLEPHQGSTKYLLVVPSSKRATYCILHICPTWLLWSISCSKTHG